jgi:hypothetical protein
MGRHDGEIDNDRVDLMICPPTPHSHLNPSLLDSDPETRPPNAYLTYIALRSPRTASTAQQLLCRNQIGIGSAGPREEHSHPSNLRFKLRSSAPPSSSRPPLDLEFLTHHGYPQEDRKEDTEPACVPLRPPRSGGVFSRFSEAD